MRIGLRVDVRQQRRWQRWLASDLAIRGHELVIVPVDDQPASYPSSLQFVLWFDRHWFRLGGEHAFDETTAADAVPALSGKSGSSSPLDIVIDLGGGGMPALDAARVLRVTFNGLPSTLGALSALLDRQPLVVALEDSAVRHVETARPAIARRDCLTEALDSVFSSVVELLVERIDRPQTAGPLDATAEATLARTAAPAVELGGPIGATRAATSHLVRLVDAKLRRYLGRKATVANRWAMALRRCRDDGLIAGRWPSQAAYEIVPDDGLRYYADPFLFEHEGRTFLFCEEFPFATGRGLISVAEIDADGRVRTPRPALERPYHLSYPFVFRMDGQIWMIPESAEAGAVELYRATDFPHGWTLERKLIEGVAGCDATIMDHAGAWWMFLTASRLRGSTWDKLRIYSSASPLGDWIEHPAGLMTIDCRLARPAGATIRRNGQLLRPTQDCSRIYGGGMTLVQIDELSRKAYRHRAVAEITVAEPSRFIGTHTYSRLGALEVVDVYGNPAGAGRVSLQCRPIGPMPMGAFEPDIEDKVVS